MSNNGVAKILAAEMPGGRFVKIVLNPLKVKHVQCISLFVIHISNVKQDLKFWIQQILYVNVINTSKLIRVIT